MKLKMTVSVFLLSILEMFGADTSQQPPQVAVPTQFDGPTTAGPAHVSRSWKNFKDPQLDCLIERALKSNLDLQITEARIREIRANRWSFCLSKKSRMHWSPAGASKSASRLWWRQRKQNRKAVDLANQLYSHGVGDFLAVLEAQESLYSSEDQSVRSNAATNLIGRYKALGGGWE